jgi:hypothetical protein
MYIYYIYIYIYIFIYLFCPGRGGLRRAMHAWSFHPWPCRGLRRAMHAWSFHPWPCHARDSDQRVSVAYVGRNTSEEHAEWPGRGGASTCDARLVVSPLAVSRPRPPGWVLRSAGLRCMPRTRGGFDVRCTPGRFTPGRVTPETPRLGAPISGSPLRVGGYISGNPLCNASYSWLYQRKSAMRATIGYIIGNPLCNASYYLYSLRSAGSGTPLYSACSGHTLQRESAFCTHRESSICTHRESVFCTPRESAIKLRDMHAAGSHTYHQDLISRKHLPRKALVQRAGLPDAPRSPKGGPSGAALRHICDFLQRVNNHQ